MIQQFPFGFLTVRTVQNPTWDILLRFVKEKHHIGEGLLVILTSRKERIELEVGQVCEDVTVPVVPVVDGDNRDMVKQRARFEKTLAFAREVHEGKPVYGHLMACPADMVDSFVILNFTANRTQRLDLTALDLMNEGFADVFISATVSEKERAEIWDHGDIFRLCAFQGVSATRMAQELIFDLWRLYEALERQEQATVREALAHYLGPIIRPTGDAGKMRKKTRAKKSDPKSTFIIPLDGNGHLDEEEFAKFYGRATQEEEKEATGTDEERKAN